MPSVEALGLLLIGLYLFDAVLVCEPGASIVVGWRPGAVRLREGIDVSLGRPRVIAFGRLLPPLDPAMIIEGARMDAGAAASLHGRMREALWPIRWLANLLFVSMLVLLPGAVLAPWGWFRPASVFALIGVCWLTIVDRDAGRDASAVPDAASRPAVTMTLLSPISAVRIVDVLARHLLADWHPVAVASVLCAREDYVALARAACFSTADDDRAPLAAFLREAGDWEAVQAAPEVEDGCAAYCPACHAQFVERASQCPDCHVPVRRHQLTGAALRASLPMETRT